MKFIALTIFVFIFVITPLYLLQTVIMPELSGLGQSYAHAGTTASALVDTSATSH